MFGDYLQAIKIVESVAYNDREGGSPGEEYQEACCRIKRELMRAWQAEAERCAVEIENYKEN